MASTELVGPGMLAFPLVVIGVTAAGLLITKRQRLELGDPFARVALAFGSGIVGYGAILLVVGFLPVLNRVGVVVLTAVLSAAAVHEWSGCVSTARELLQRLGGAIRREPLIVLVSLALLGLAFGAGVRHPVAPDEVAYHWAAPVRWADAERWVTTPLRFTNGFHLAEVLYTPSAVFESPATAHWFHTTTLILLAIGAAALARRFNASGTFAAAAVFAIPAATGQSWLAYNDIFAAALVVCACVAASARGSARSPWITGLLLAGAISVKPVLALSAPAVLVFWILAERRDDGHVSLGQQFRRVLALATPVLVAGAAWIAYTFWATGDWLQRGGIVVAHGSDDPSHGLATIRIPHVADVALAPFLPVLTGIIGQREPYGGRTGLVLTVFIPVMIVSAFLMSRCDRRRLSELAIPALAGYIAAATLIVRTRFLIAIYAIAGAAVALTVDWLRRQPWPRTAELALWIFRGCVVIGVADSARRAL
jgi:hypothetical protein